MKIMKFERITDTVVRVTFKKLFSTGVNDYALERGIYSDWINLSNGERELHIKGALYSFVKMEIYEFIVGSTTIKNK